MLSLHQLRLITSAAGYIVLGVLYSVDRMTDTCENITLRAVIIFDFKGMIVRKKYIGTKVREVKAWFLMCKI